MCATLRALSSQVERRLPCTLVQAPVTAPHLLARAASRTLTYAGRKGPRTDEFMKTKW